MMNITICTNQELIAEMEKQVRDGEVERAAFEHYLPLMQSTPNPVAFSAMVAKGSVLKYIYNVSESGLKKRFFWDVKKF